jgi:Zn-finger nucleic acid-binding protein
MSVAPTGSGTGAARGVASAFRNRQRGAIERSKPVTHTAFVSAFRGKQLSCPKCNAALAFEGDRWDCKTCAGTFVEDAALMAMVSDILKTPWGMPPVSGTAGAAACPVCATAMTVERLASTTIDRCERHGVWFDEDELATVLLETSGEQEPHGIGAWIKRLFT